MNARLIAWARLLGMTTVVAVILAISGGFGSSGLTIVPRIAYWFGLCTLGAVTGNLAARMFPDRWFGQRPWLVWTGLAACIILAMTPAVAITNTLINHRTLGWKVIGDVLPGVIVTTGGMTALAMLVRRQHPVETHAAAAGAEPAKFLARLPASLRDADLWAVEAQDHYLRLHTSKGRELILMRLTDAVAELEGLEGARTHRSWWVARAAVTGVERADGRATLTLVDGAEAPVSRAYVKALREAGWFGGGVSG